MMDKDNELLDLHIDALHKKSRSELIEILKKIVQDIEHEKDCDNGTNWWWQISKVSD